MTTPTPESVIDAGLTLPVRAGDLADLLSAELIGNPDVQLSELGSITDGSASTLTFIRSKNFAKQWGDSSCGGALVSAGIEVPGHDPVSRVLLIVEDADESMVLLLAAIDPGRERALPGVHPSAIIDPAASVDPSATISAGCRVGRGSMIDEGVVLMPNVVIGASVKIGTMSILEPGVVIEDRCVIGDRCHIGSNSVIGSDGFGYLPPTENRPVMKVPQIGAVEIGDEVELGACVTVDRAKFGATTIGSRTKIDNQVHIAHNCVIGSDTLICGRTTLGGSVTIGEHVMIGGAVVLNDHASVGKHAKIAGGAMVLESVPENETYAGVPAMPARSAMLNYSSFRELSSFMRKVEKRLCKLEPDKPGS